MKNSINGVVAITIATLAGHAAAQITFYEREEFQGDSFTTQRQIGDMTRFGFNDSASSVVVGGDPAERWQVCEDTRFNGRCAVLRPGKYPTLRAIGLNNRITSVQALARVDAPAAQVLPAANAVTTANDSRIVVYGREGLRGRALTVQQDIPYLVRSGFNDRISSVEVFGAHWEICQGGGFTGPCAVLRAGQYPSLDGLGLENRVSSIRALVRDNGPGAAPPMLVFFEQDGFRGRSFALQSELADLRRTGLDDRSSSVQVSGGPWELCRDGGFQGPCVVLRQGQYPSLAAMGLDNQVSSARIVGRDLYQRDNRADAGPAMQRPYDPRRRGGERLFQAEVTSVRAVVQTPEQRCWVEREAVSQESRRNVPAIVIGAVIGGILGHQVGDGRGRDLATVGGAVAGGAIGAKVGRNGQPEEQDVQRCTNPPPQARADLWDVSYVFRGQEHRVQMTSEPGATITVNGDGEPRV